MNQSQARNVVIGMHKDCESNVCKPGGINSLVAQFTMTYYHKGIRSVVANILKGTSKLSKRIETEPPLPTAMRTMGVSFAISESQYSTA